MLSLDLSKVSFLHHFQFLLKAKLLVCCCARLLHLILFVVFPENCTYYDPPLPKICHTSVWLSVGCLSSGFGEPSSKADQEFVKNKNIRYV